MRGVCLQTQTYRVKVSEIPLGSQKYVSFYTSILKVEIEDRTLMYEFP